MSRRVIPVLLLLSFLLSSTIQPVLAAGGKQIVFIMGDTDKKFTYVSISGYNQNNEWKTWTKSSTNGFTVVYTKDWWWVENFVQITFTIKDSFGKETIKQCLIDALEQPRNSASTVIVYASKSGCLGGEAGSVQNIGMVSQMKNSLNTISTYIPFDNLVKLAYNEGNVLACFGGIALTVESGGLSLSSAMATAFITKACHTSAEMILKYFFTQQ